MHDSHYGRGKLDGEVIGIAKGIAETLTKIIQRKFSKLLSQDDEQEISSKIQQASIEQLNQWVDDILDVVTLDDLFQMFGFK